MKTAIRLLFAAALVSAQVIVSSSTSSVVGNFTCTGTDDHVQIQAAIDLVNSLGGGRVQLTDGIFNVNAQINITSQLELSGESQNGTIVRLVSNARPWKVGSRFSPGSLRGFRVLDLAVSNITFDGNRASNTGVGDAVLGKHGFDCLYCSNVVLLNVAMINFPGHGFHFNGAANQYSQNVTITDCIANNNEFDGFILEKTINATISFNNATSNGRNGFNFISDSHEAAFFNNSASRNGFGKTADYNGNGINVASSAPVTIGNITFKPSSGTTSNVLVYHNSLSSNVGTGIGVENTFNVTVRNNAITSNNGLCMEFGSTTNTTIESNICAPNDASVYLVVPNDNMTVIDQQVTAFNQGFGFGP